MTKKAFKDSLQYGLCQGSGEFLRTECRYGNAGQEIKSCPLNRVEPHTKTKCNCCKKCRDHCGWTAQIKEVNQRDREKMMNEIVKLAEEHNAKK